MGLCILRLMLRIYIWVTEVFLYRMELADSYAGYWRFTSWFGDQCLLQQSFHVNPAMPVTN